MKGERMAKRSTFTSIVRKRLSDITNYSQPQPKMLIRKEKPSQVSPASEDLVKQLIKEKMTLMKVIEEREVLRGQFGHAVRKIIELSENELQNLRINFQKLQLQNWNLAQSNSQILAELNLGREKVKAQQHELVCKDALLKAKNIKKEEGEIVTEECIPKANDNAKPCESNRRRSARSKSMGPSTTRRQVSEKENVENKRRCVRRQSSSFKSQERVPTEDMFKIQDTKLSVTLQADPLPQIKMLAA